MEILKGFSFDIQRFGNELNLTVATMTLASGATNESGTWTTTSGWSWASGSSLGAAPAAVLTLSAAADATGLATLANLTSITVNGITDGVKVDNGAGDLSWTDSGSTLTILQLSGAGSLTAKSLTLLSGGNSLKSGSNISVKSGTVVFDDTATNFGDITVAAGATATQGTVGLTANNVDGTIALSAQKFTLKNGEFTLSSAGATYDVAAVSNGTVLVSGALFSGGAVGSVTGTGIVLKSGTFGLDSSNPFTQLTAGDTVFTLTARSVMTGITSASSKNVTIGTFTSGSASWATTANVTVAGLTFAGTGEFSGSNGVSAATVSAGSLTIGDGAPSTLDVTAAGGAVYNFTSNARATVASTGAVSNFTAGTLGLNNASATVGFGGTTEGNEIKFTQATGTVTSAGVVSNLLATGVVETGKGISSVKINDTTFTRASGNTDTMSFTLITGTLGTDNIGVVDGSIAISSTSPVYGSTNAGVGVESVSIKNGSALAKFVVGDASVTGLSAGEIVTITTAASSFVYEAMSSTMIKYTEDGVFKGYYELKDASDTLESVVLTGGAITDTKVAALVASDIDLSKHEKNAWFMADGIPTYTEPSSYAAKLTVSGSGENMTRTIEIKSALTAAVLTNGVQATITDTTSSSVTNTVFVLRSGTLAGVQGKSFEVSSEGVISNASGTITLLANSTKVGNTTSTIAHVAVSGTVNVDTKAVSGGTTDVVTYVAGAGLNEAKVTYKSTESPITITESSNETDTVVTEDGAITGLDAGGIVKNAVDEKFVKTAGSETSSSSYTLNGTTWTVTGDANVDFKVETDNASKVDAIASIDVDATVSTDKKFTEETIDVNGQTFGKIISKDGVTFTGTKKDSNASITLNAKGESVQIGTNTYAISSTSDDVTIDDSGKITGLTDGDVVTIHKTGSAEGKDTIVLTANNSALVVSGFDASGNSLDATTYMRDSDETSFTATVKDFAGTKKANVEVSGGQSGTDISGFKVTTGTNATKTIESVSNGMWLDKDGNTLADNSANKAVSQVFIDDDKVTYTEIGDKAQAVEVTNAETTHEWNITTNGGKDTIDYAGKQSATISAGAGNDTVSVNSDADVTVNLGAGKDEVTLLGKGAHTVVAGDGDKTINASGTSGDVVIDGRGSGKKSITRLGATGGDATLYGGDGNDTIVARGLDDSVVGGAGNNLFDVSQSSMKVSDYDVSKDTFLVASTSLAASALGGDGVVTLGGGIKADVSAGTGTSGYYAVSAKSTVSGAKAQTYGWTTDNGGTINMNGSYEKAVVLVGSHNDGAKDLLVGGSKNDTLVGGSNDSLYGGGAGKNTITMSGKGAYVGVGGTAKDTASGFTTGFDNSEADTVLLVDGSMSDATFSVASTGTGTSRDVTVKSGQASLALSSLAVDSVSGAYQMLVGENKVYAIAEGAAVSLNGDNFADYYIGTKSSKVDGSQVDTAFKVDLSDTEHIRNIKQVTGGSENTTLMGSGVDATLSAGTGSATLWGGAGKDSLIGGNAADTFVFMAGDGKDTISSFATGTGDTADVIDFWQSSPTGVTRTSTSQFKVTLSDNDAVTVNTSTSGGANDVIQWKDENGNKGTVKVGIKGQNNGFTYESGVGGYYGSSTGQDTLTVSTSDDVNVWLDGSQGTAFADINAINASSATGNAILAGDSNSQVITGGRGSSSLWGGAGSTKDTLVAGNGTNTFFYGYGEGSDLVNNTGENDVINLYNITLNDLSGYEINGNKVTITTKAGDTLTVNGKATTYLVGDGQGNIITAHANHSTNKWE